MRTRGAIITAICGLCLSVSIFSSGHSSAGRTAKTAAADEAAELSITSDASPDTVVAGANVTYRLTVTNEGPGVATAVTVADSLPDETTLVSCTATGGGICGGEGNERTVTFNSIAPDTSETITLVAAVNCVVEDGREIDNTASIRSAAQGSGDDEEENETVFVSVAHPPPSLTGVSVNPATVWPPDHKMVLATVDYQVTAVCAPVTTKLAVGSNEPVNGTGDGDTSPDWEVVDPHHVRLRAERAGGGNGRIYTIKITATDALNQSTGRAVQVSVPKNQKAKP
jgi:uncharacterized repeat protein (TIGR01451 family)